MAARPTAPANGEQYEDDQGKPWIWSDARKSWETDWASLSSAAPPGDFTITGAGSSSTGADIDVATFTVPTSGTYQASITITGASGSGSRVSKHVDINSSPGGSNQVWTEYYSRDGSGYNGIFSFPVPALATMDLSSGVTYYVRVRHNSGSFSPSHVVTIKFSYLGQPDPAIPAGVDYFPGNNVEFEIHGKFYGGKQVYGRSFLWTSGLSANTYTTLWSGASVVDDLVACHGKFANDYYGEVIKETAGSISGSLPYGTSVRLSSGRLEMRSERSVQSGSGREFKFWVEYTKK